MEEILASIRRIIADDDTKPSAPAAPKSSPQAAAPPPAPEPEPPPPEPEPLPPEPEPEPQLASVMEAPIPEPEPAAEVLDLTEEMTAEAPAFQTIDPEPDVVFAEAATTPQPSAPEPPPMQESRLLSGATSAAVDAAFNSLAQTVLLQNARTLEDLVREMLRPMLKTWLDDNLPGLVERLVRAEIERVSRGR